MLNYQEIEVNIIEELNEELSFHSDMELFYVIEGEMQVQTGDAEYILGKEDIILLNMGTQNKIRTFSEPVICNVRYDNRLISELLRNRNCSFQCNSVVDMEHSYEEMRKILRELVYLQLADYRKTESYKYSILYRILDLLTENFMIEKEDVSAPESSGDVKLLEIIRYVHQNFGTKVSLSELSEQMYVSTSTLSRLFKKQTGIYFAEYVNQVRLKYAVSELIHTENHITRIAMDCGFSSASSFNRVFRESYGIAPTEYRSQQRTIAAEQPENIEKLKKKLRQELQIAGKSQREEGVDNRFVVEVDVKNSCPYQKKWNQTINIGSVYNLTLANLQFHTLSLVEELGFSHVRVWNVFSKKLMICDGISTEYFNYDKLDTVFDFLVSHHIHAFIDLGKRPDTAVKTPGVTVFYEEEYINFQSRKAWEAMVQDFVHHLTVRYGKDIVENWIFELSYDVVHAKQDGGCYQDENFDFFHAYQFVYQTVKRELPNAQVGGPSAIPGYQADILTDFLLRCRQCQCVPDFISLILFPYKSDQQHKKSTYRRNPEKDFEIQMINTYRQILKKMELENCKLYVSEWNNSVSNRNYLNDSCFRGAYFAKKVCEIWDSVDMLCCWMGSDWMSSYYDSRSIVNGASGILTKDSIKKPAWYAISFLNSLGDSVIERGENYIITKHSDTSYAVLCFNFKWFSCNYFFLDEYEVSPSRIQNLFENTDRIQIQITLQNLLVGGEYIVKKRQVNGKKGNILGEWHKFGYDSNLERSDIKYIQEVSIPNMERQRVKAHRKSLTLEVELEEHEITLLHIFKQEE